jgi:NADH-ubiquinone oxidoreductase chain 5
MVTAGIFLVLRMSTFFEYTKLILNLLLFIGSLTAFMSGTIGVVQYDIKKVIAYSTCSQLGFMLLACGLSNYFVSFFHLINHAFFKAMLFLCAGSVIHSLFNEQDIRRMGGLSKITPLTTLYFLIGTLSISGFVFLTGFYSKDFILEHFSFFYSNYNFSYIWYLSFFFVLITTGLTAFYSLRLFFLGFLELPITLKQI